MSVLYFGFIQNSCCVEGSYHCFMAYWVFVTPRIAREKPYFIVLPSFKLGITVHERRESAVFVSMTGRRFLTGFKWIWPPERRLCGNGGIMHSVVVSRANTALGCASCCIILSTTPSCVISRTALEPVLDHIVTDQ